MSRNVSVHCTNQQQQDTNSQHKRLVAGILREGVGLHKKEREGVGLHKMVHPEQSSAHCPVA
jgi:hypothetical protein